MVARIGARTGACPYNQIIYATESLPKNESAGNPSRLVFFERAGLRAVGQTIAAAGAFMLQHFVHVMDVLHLRMDGVLGADFATQAAGDAEAFDDSNFHNGQLASLMVGQAHHERELINPSFIYSVHPEPLSKAEARYSSVSLRAAKSAARLRRPRTKKKIENVTDASCSLCLIS